MFIRRRVPTIPPLRIHTLTLSRREGGRVSGWWWGEDGFARRSQEINQSPSPTPADFLLFLLLFFYFLPLERSVESFQFCWRRVFSRNLPVLQTRPITGTSANDIFHRDPSPPFSLRKTLLNLLHRKKKSLQMHHFIN